MESEQITICVKCRHFRTTRNGQIWYDQFCGHPDLENPLVIDPVTGLKVYGHKNDLGRTVFTDNPHPHARDIDDGNCQHYESTTKDTDMPKSDQEIVLAAVNEILSGTDSPAARVICKGLVSLATAYGQHTEIDGIWDYLADVNRWASVIRKEIARQRESVQPE